ncbi:MAG: hypothetical protein PHQ27_04260 [Victivallales bacterium]|nr:hypothetical protein [Victivallales bacterium]
MKPREKIKPALGAITHGLVLALAVGLTIGPAMTGCTSGCDLDLDTDAPIQAIAARLQLLFGEKTLTTEQKEALIAAVRAELAAAGYQAEDAAAALEQAGRAAGLSDASLQQISAWIENQIASDSTTKSK